VPSLIPAGGATVATLAIVPLTPAVPVRVKVTLPPLGSVGMTIPVPCTNASVVLPGVGQAAPAAGLAAGHRGRREVGHRRSCTIAPLAAAGPLLLTTSV